MGIMTTAERNFSTFERSQNCPHAEHSSYICPRLKESSDAIYCCKSELINETTCCNDPNRSIFEVFSIQDNDQTKHDFQSITAMVYLILVGLLIVIDLFSFLFRGTEEAKSKTIFRRKDSAERSECHANKLHE